VGVPGASIFKDKWVEWLRGRQITLCYDNDDPGRDGAQNAYKKLKNIVAEIRFTNWPSNTRVGYDMRDFITLGLAKSSAKTVYKKLETLIKPYSGVEQTKRKPIPDDIEEKAKAILKDPNLLDILIKEVQKTAACPNLS